MLLTVGAIWLTIRGVKLSTTVVGIAVLAQVAVMVAVCAIVLVEQRAHLSAIPFSWARLTGGLTGLSAGFPLALYMFIGWENGPALAEECRDPRRTVPWGPLPLDRGRGRPVRLLRLRDRHRLQVRRLVYRAVFRPVPDRGGSVSRRGGRPGLGGRNRVRARHPDLSGELPGPHAVRRRPDRAAPAWLAHLRPRSETPINALVCHGTGSAGLGIIGIWWVSHLVTADTGSMDPVGLYAECSTMGTIVILFVYFLTTLSLPVFMWRRHRDTVL